MYALARCMARARRSPDAARRSRCVLVSQRLADARRSADDDRGGARITVHVCPYVAPVVGLASSRLAAPGEDRCGRSWSATSSKPRSGVAIQRRTTRAREAHRRDTRRGSSVARHASRRTGARGTGAASGARKECPHRDQGARRGNARHGNAVATRSAYGRHARASSRSRAQSRDGLICCSAWLLLTGSPARVRGGAPRSTMTSAWSSRFSSIARTGPVAGHCTNVEPSASLTR